MVVTPAIWSSEFGLAFLHEQFSSLTASCSNNETLLTPNNFRSLNLIANCARYHRITPHGQEALAFLVKLATDGSEMSVSSYRQIISLLQGGSLTSSELLTHVAQVSSDRRSNRADTFCVELSTNALIVLRSTDFTYCSRGENALNILLTSNIPIEYKQGAIETAHLCIYIEDRLEDFTAKAEPEFKRDWFWGNILAVHQTPTFSLSELSFIWTTVSRESSSAVRMQIRDDIIRNLAYRDTPSEQAGLFILSEISETFPPNERSPIHTVWLRNYMETDEELSSAAQYPILHDGHAVSFLLENIPDLSSRELNNKIISLLRQALTSQDGLVMAESRAFIRRRLQTTSSERERELICDELMQATDVLAERVQHSNGNIRTSLLENLIIVIRYGTRTRSHESASAQLTDYMESGLFTPREVLATLFTYLQLETRVFKGQAHIRTAVLQGKGSAAQIIRLIEGAGRDTYIKRYREHIVLATH